MLGHKTLPILQKALNKLKQGFVELPVFDYEANLDTAKIEEILLEVAELMQNNFPYHHPQYAGQMLKPPHPIASLAYSLSMWINPNNHAIDGGRASTEMEKQVVHQIATMFGWHQHLGHLCGGGTIANLEALWVSSLVKPEQLIVASEQAHYTHQRICSVLKIPFKQVKCDLTGRMSMDSLEELLRTEKIGTVVVTLGTTSTGSVDPLADVIVLQKKYHFRIHVDAAYGGYFKLVDNLSDSVCKAFDALISVDSIVIDPHKHGLQPYGCGCVIFNDPSVGKFYKHDSPYTYFVSNSLHLGEISLECSRSGSAAVALFATLKLLPLIKGGVFANNLSKSIKAAVDLYDRLKNDDKFLVAFAPDLDIVTWAVNTDSPNQSSKLAQALFTQLARNGIHLAIAKLPASLYKQDANWQNESVTCMRSCLIKPQHFENIDIIWQLLNSTAQNVLRSKVT